VLTFVRNEVFAKNPAILVDMGKEKEYDNNRK
jgi:hypothetical protein